MCVKMAILASIVALFGVCAAQADVIYSMWVGGSEGEWGDPGNWNPHTVPDNKSWQTFVVTIDSNSIGADEVVVGLKQSRTIDKLDCYGQVGLQKWTSGRVEVTIYNGLANYGELDIDDLNIRGNITNAAGATLSLYGGDKSIHDGNVYNQAGAMVEVADKVIVFNGDIDNAGVIRIAPSSSLETKRTLRNVGEIKIYDGACGAREVFDNNSTGTITGYGTLFGGADLFNNKGKIYAFGGSLSVASFGAAIINSGLLANKPLASLHITHVTAQGGDVNNQGTIEVHAGGVAFDCNLVNTSNGTIQLLGGNLSATQITQRADANFAGFGGITVADGILIESGAEIELTGPTNIVGDVNIPGKATLQISDGTTLVTGQTTCNGTIHMKGGRIIPQGGLSGDCSIICELGLYTNIADFNLDGEVNFKDFVAFADTWLWQTRWD